MKKKLKLLALIFTEEKVSTKSLNIWFVKVKNFDRYCMIVLTLN